MQFPLLEIDRAQNWGQFTAALARWPGPGQNFVYADVDGNIGYHAAGKLPNRRGYNGDVPVDGSSGDFDWDGFIPFDQLPAAFNPPAGSLPRPIRIRSAGLPTRCERQFRAARPCRQIRDLLSARNGWRAQDLIGVQRDLYSGFSKFLARKSWPPTTSATPTTPG